MALVRLISRLLGRKPEPEFPIDLDSDEDKRTRSFIIWFIWALIVVVGIPVWWKTTEVYRAPLPFYAMAAWTDAGATDYTVPISITLHVPADSLDAQTAARLPGIVEGAVNAVFDKRGKELDGFEVRASASPSSSDEGRKVDVDPPKVRLSFTLSLARDVSESWKTLDEGALDNTVQTTYGPSANGQYRIMLLPTLQQGGSAAAAGEASWRVYAGKHRTLLVYLPTPSSPAEALENFGDAAVTVITGVFGSELYHLRKSVAEESAREIDVLRTLKYAREYLATFTLLNANPNEVLVTWDIESAVQAYFAPLLRSISGISNVSVASQILYYSELPMPPLRSTGMSEQPFSFFRAEHLPHFVNTAEWNLASAATNATPVHFLLYVPKRSEHPLYILDQAKEIIPGNTWLVPSWGGAHISNLPLDNLNTSSNGAKFHFGAKELRETMTLFVTQFRSLLGVQSALLEKDFVSPPAKLARYPSIYAAPDPTRGITDLELDRLSRKRAARNVLDTARGLASLGKLVSTMQNMVVPDRIKLLVEDSLARLRSFMDLVGKGQLDAAFASSAEALSLSEAAFFDPTMVSMLYFPDEHRYAVYMPFFVPVGVPLVAALVGEVRRWRDRRKKGLDNKDKAE